MAKYTEKQLISELCEGPQSHSVALTAIANELAEANRLKRIEIELKIHELNLTDLNPKDPEDSQTILDDAEYEDFLARLVDEEN